jgi:peptidoglycan-associated lipoprotein
LIYVADPKPRSNIGDAMRGTHAARYLFAACLCASTVDLIVVDCVIGPMALRTEPASAMPISSIAESSAAPSRDDVPAVKAATTTTLATANATTSTPSAAGEARGGPLAPQVVARFESEQPSASWEDLRPLAAAMTAEPTTRVVLEGHADQYGDPSHNRTLSLDRAKWAQARLVELGVSAARIEVIAHGAERPLAEGDDDAAVAINRRVEFRWIPRSPLPEDGDR